RASMVMDHGRTGPLGALGGADGGLNRVRIERGSKSYVPPHLSKDQDIELQPGDRIYVSTPGGGGFGDPLKREPQRVAQDVARGYYTHTQAESLFGVILGSDGSVDVMRTGVQRKRN
ncbi:MAG: hydantoinase B/oxoprolinase family protein, partial [Burkholderiales bacterium]|nr:hydantoinase B/oxoprolinase family protein [Burkholderiales bacterium]